MSLQLLADYCFQIKILHYYFFNFWKEPTSEQGLNSIGGFIILLLFAPILSFFLIALQLCIPERKIFTFGNGLTSPIRAGKLRMISLLGDLLSVGGHCVPQSNVCFDLGVWSVECWISDHLVGRQGRGQKEVGEGAYRWEIEMWRGRWCP